MTTMTATLTTMTTSVECRECGEDLDMEARDAYRTLYGAALWRPGDLAERLEGYITDHPQAGDAEALAGVLASYLGFEPGALVQAVRHRLNEYGE